MTKQTIFGLILLLVMSSVACQGGRTEDAAQDEYVSQLPTATAISAEKWLIDAGRFERSFEYEQALAAYDEALKLDDSLAEAYFGRALVNLRLDMPEMALDDLGAAIALDGQQSDYFFERARLYESKGESLAALDDYRAVLALDSDNSVAVSRAINLLQALDPESAIAQTLSLLDAAPNQGRLHQQLGDLYNEQGDSEPALAAYDEAKALGVSSSDMFAKQATLQLANEQYTDAVDSLNAALALDGTQATLYAERAQAYDALGQLEEALESYRLALRNDEGNLAYLRAESDVRYRLDRLASLREPAEAILAQAPNDAQAYLWLGLAQRAAKAYPEAVDSFTQAIELAPSLTQAYFERGRLLADGVVSGSSCADAIPDLEQVVAVDNAQSDAHYALGVCQRNVGDYDAAITHLSAAVALDATLEDAYVPLANLHLERGAPIAALDAYDQGIEAFPQNSAFWGNRGFIQRQVGNIDAAEADLIQATNLRPEWFRPVRELANLQQDRGDALYEPWLAENGRSAETIVLLQEEEPTLVAVTTNYERAVGSYSRAITLQSTNLSMIFERATLQRMLGNFEAALPDYERLIAEQPDQDQHLYDRALVYIGLERYDEARADLNEVIVRQTSKALEEAAYRKLWQLP